MTRSFVGPLDDQRPTRQASGFTKLKWGRVLPRLPGRIQYDSRRTLRVRGPFLMQTTSYITGETVPWIWQSGLRTGLFCGAGKLTLVDQRRMFMREAGSLQVILAAFVPRAALDQ